jgi:DNA-packaging protein gp3
MTPNNIGRPRLYGTGDELRKAIDKYFNDCDSRIKTIWDKDGNETNMVVPAPYTISGLCLAIGMDRNQILEYAEHDEYSYHIKYARDRCIADVERRLLETSNQAGAIFWLKNNAFYRDTQEVRQTNVAEQTVIYRPEKLPDIVDGEIADKGLPEPKDSDT